VVGAQLGRPRLGFAVSAAHHLAATRVGGPPRRPEMEDHVAETYNGYCVKCKEKRDFEGEVKVSESGRRMAQGPCPVCSTKMNRILGKS
jgi:hypothetical protein